jgi:hypothetical protein
MGSHPNSLKKGNNQKMLGLNSVASNTKLQPIAQITIAKTYEYLHLSGLGD